MASSRDRSPWLHGNQFYCLDTHRFGERPWRIVLLGPPGVGKGTQATLLAEVFGGCALSTGDVFRELVEREASPDTATARALERMSRGQLVPDDLVITLMRNRRQCFRCGAGFILDGFPRTLVQANAFDALLASEHLRLDAVLHYTLPLPGLVARVSGRRICPDCHAVYNEVTRPPYRSGRCDRCGGELIRRPSDNPATQYDRLELHAQAVLQVAEHYRAQRLLVDLAASDPPEKIFARTLELLASRGLAVPTSPEAALAPQGDSTRHSPPYSSLA